MYPKVHWQVVGPLLLFSIFFKIHHVLKRNGIIWIPGHRPLIGKKGVKNETL